MHQNNISENLDQWNKIGRYSAWMFHTFQDYIGDSVLEIGAGMGRLVDFYVRGRRDVVAVDIFDNQIEYMNNRFRDFPYFKAVNRDILSDDISDLENRFDTVLCINTLEHLSDDYLAVAKMGGCVLNGGNIVIMVPAWQKLYCQLDRNVGHYRRYDPGRLDDIAEKDHLRIIKHIYFNRMGIIPYYIKGKRTKAESKDSFSSSLNEGNSKLYNIASAVLEPIEKRFPPKKGLTELIVLQK